jgi:hypothetical protein
MTHPQAADGGMASNMEGSYKYIEYSRRQPTRGGTPDWGWVSANNSSQKKKKILNVYLPSLVMKVDDYVYV